MPKLWLFWLNFKQNALLKISFDLLNSSINEYGNHFMGIFMALTISSSSAKTKSYADNATQKIMAVTPSKQWIHFFLSDLCPPTSNILENESYKLVITMIMSHTFNILHTEMTDKISVGSTMTKCTMQSANRA